MSKLVLAEIEAAARSVVTIVHIENGVQKKLKLGAAFLDLFMIHCGKMVQIYFSITLNICNI